MTLETLINAATLKGYLMFSEAPQEIITVAQTIVDDEIKRLRPPVEDAEEHAPHYFTRPLVTETAQVNDANSPVTQTIVGFSEEDLKLGLPDLIIAASKNAPRHDDSRFAAPDTAAGDVSAPPPAELPRESVKGDDAAPPIDLPLRHTPFSLNLDIRDWTKHIEKENIEVPAPETTLTEENSIPPATEDAKEGNDAPVTTGGAIAKAKRVGNYKTKLEASMLPAIKEALTEKSFHKVGADHGVTGMSIVNFLKRHGLDHRDFKKQGRNWREKPGKAEVAVDEDGWPLAVKPEKPMKMDTPRPDAREEAIARLLDAMPPAKDKPYAKFTRGDVPKILRLLGDLDINTVGERLGVQAKQIDAFLNKYGIDYRTLPPKTTARMQPVASESLVKYQTVTATDRWGNESERQVPAPIGEYEDPESSAKVTKYPPMYAFGAHPPRNARVKGGS